MAQLSAHNPWRSVPSAPMLLLLPHLAHGPPCRLPLLHVALHPVQLYEESLKDADGNSPGPATDVFWQFSTPAGLQSILAYVSRRYQRPEVWLTENGMAVPGEANMTREAALQDVKRLEFFRYRGVE